MEALLKYNYKKERLNFSQDPAPNLWDAMDGPEEPTNANRTALQEEEMRDAINRVIEAVEREEGVSAELM